MRPSIAIIGALAVVVTVGVVVAVLLTRGSAPAPTASLPAAAPTSTPFAAVAPPAGATPTPPPTGAPATPTPPPAVRLPTATATPTPPPNIVEGLRLSSGSDTGRSDRDGITSVTQPELVIDASTATSVEVLLNGVVVDTLDGNEELEFTFPEELSEGVYGVEIRLLDSSGSELELVGPLFVTIDTTSPLPPLLVRLSSDTDFGLSTNDGLTNTSSPAIIGISGFGDTVRVLIDGNAIGDSVAVDTGEWRVGLRGLSEGEHTVTAVAEDAAGNSGTSSVPYSFTIDLTGPQLSVSQPAEGASLDGNQSLTGTFSDGESGVAGINYRLGSGTPQPLFADPQSGSFSGPLVVAGAPSGSQTLTVTAFDAAGNSTEVIRRVSVDIEEPFVVTQTRPANGANDVGATVKPEIFFSLPIDPSTVNRQSIRVTSGGETMAANIVPSGDGNFAWVFIEQPLPGSSSVTVTVIGDLVRAAQGGRVLDGDFDGAPGGDLSFTYTTVSLQMAPNTSLSGVIADAGPDNQPMTADDIGPGQDGVIGTADDVALLPIQGVEISLLGIPGVAAITGSDGSYFIDSVPAGSVKVKLDGLTGTAPNGFYFPVMVMDTQVRLGEDNDIMPGHRIAYLPRIPNEILRTVSASQTTMIVADEASAPGLSSAQRSLLSIEIQPNSLVGEDGSSLSSAQIGISTVAPELVMDMLPPGVLQHTFDITVQAPGVANFSTPAPMTFPNVFDAAPGTQLNFLSFDHNTGRLEIEGTATVSADGSSVATDPGTGIVRTGWHGLTRPGSITLPGCNPEEEPTIDVDPIPHISRIRKVNTGVVFLVPGFRDIQVPMEDELWTPDARERYQILVENRRSDGSATTKDEGCRNLNETPLVVEVVIIGPATEFMHSVEWLGKGAGKFSEEKILKSEDQTDDKAEQIFGFLLYPGDKEKIWFDPIRFLATTAFRGGGPITNEESLFGATVNIRAFKWREPEKLLIDETIYLYSWTDISDTHDWDGFAFMPDATVDGKGGGLTRRPVKLRMPELPTFESDHPAFRFETGDKPGFVFDPLEIKNDQLGGITVVSPRGQKTGTIPVKGDGIIVDVWVNDEKFIEALERSFANFTFTDLRNETLKNQIDTAGKREQLWLDVVAETLVRLDPFITAGEDRQKGTRDDGGIRFASTPVDGLTLNIKDWTGPSTPFPLEVGTNRVILGKATGIDWADPDPLRVVKQDRIETIRGDRSLQNRQRFAFKLTEAVNEKNDGTIQIFIDRWVRVIDRELLSDPRQALVEGVASTIAHEIGHAVGIVHTSTNFKPKDRLQEVSVEEINDRNARKDIMAQGADFKGELSFPVTGSMYKMAIGQQWTATDNLNARKYWGRYIVAINRIARRDLKPVRPFNIEGGGADDGLPLLDFIGSGVSILIANPDTDPALVDVIEFGTVSAGSGSPGSKTFGLFNTGDRDLTVERVFIDPQSDPAFSVNSILTGTVLEPGESTEVVVTFAPESGGPVTGNLVIQTDGSFSGGVYSLSGSGQRQEPDIDILVVNNNLGGVVASSGSAGPQVAGTVTNIGSQPLTVTSATIESEDPVFAVSAIDGPVTLQPGESLDISASFAPIVTGLQRATIVIESNDPDSPSSKLGLTGTGVAEFPGSLVEYGNDFIALITPASDLSPVLRSRTDDLGNWEFFLPPETIAYFTTFDPVSGLVSAGGTLTSPAGEDSVMPTVPFAASVQPDLDGDGLPADIEFAIGTSDANQDSDGDGIDDFTAVLLGLDPLGAVAIPTGIVSQLTLAGDAEAVAIGSSPANPDAIVAYVATGQSGFASVDISDPLMPVILAELNLPGQSSDLAADLGNGRVYVAAGRAGVHVIDVSDPANPTLIQTISSPSAVSRIVLTEHGIFAVGNRELLAIDAGIGEVVAQLTVTGVPLEAIAAEGDHVFVTDTGGSFAAVNVSQALVEGVMTVTGTMDAHRVRRLTVLDGVAYLAGEGSYTTCDVSDPANITLISETAGGEPTNFGVELVPGGDGVGALVYALFDREPTVLVMDTSDPSATGAFLTRFDLPENPRDATFAAGLVVIADGRGGLIIVNYQSIDASGVAPTGLLSVGSKDEDADTPGTQLTEGSIAKLRVEAADDVLVRTVELLRDGVVVQSDASFPFELFALLPPLARTDSVTFQARVTDTGGNSSLTGTVEILLLQDVRGPRLVSMDPNDRGFAAAGEVQVEALFSEPLAIDTVTASNIRLNGPGGSDVTPSDLALIDGGRRVRLTYSSLSAGIYTLTVDSSRVTDVGGTAAGVTPITSTFEVINATNRWINPAGGNWSDAGNWSAGRVPDSTDVVVISVPGAVTVQLDRSGGDGEAAELYVDERLEVASIGLVVQRHGAISGSALFNGQSTLISEGTFELRGSMVAGGGFRFRAVTFENTGTLLAAEGGLAITEGVFENRGLVRARGFTLGQNPGFRIGGEGPITFNNREDGVIEIINQGQFNAFSPGSQINNSGVIRSEGGDGMFGGLNTSGVIEVVSGAFRIAASGFVSDGGTFRVADGAVLNLLSQNMEFRGDSVFEGDGIVNDDSNIEVVSGATLTIDMPNGFKFSQNKTFTGAGTVTNLQLFIWKTGTIDLDTAFENRGTIEIKGVPTVPVQLDGDLTNFGTILHTENKTLQIENATLHNMPGGVYDFRSDGDIDSRDNNNTHFFINEGTLTKTGGTDISDLDVVWTNSGPVQVTSGIIRMWRKADLTDTVIEVAAGTQFRMSSGNHTIKGTFAATGEGRIIVGNSPTFITIAAGTEAVFANAEGLRFHSGTWNGGGSIRLAGDSFWFGGTFALEGGVVNESGRTFIVSGSGTKAVKSGTFLNEGAVIQEGTGHIEIEDGSFVNAPAATIELLSTGGFDLLGSDPATLVNQGSIVKRDNTSATRMDVDFTNSGTLDIRTGRLDFTRVFVQTSGSTTLSGGHLSVGSGGTMAINGGILAGAGTITGSVVNRASIHVGGQSQVGTLIITREYTQTSSGTLYIELAGTGANEHDQLDVRSTGAGAVTLDGTLAVSVISGFTPVATDVFTVLDYRNVTNDFTSFNGLNVGGVTLTPSANSGDYTLTAE